MHRTQIGQPSHILHLKSTIAKMRRQKCKARPQEVTTPSSEVINYKVSFKKIVKSILNLETVLLWSELIYKSLKQVIVRRFIILEINPIQDLQFLKNEEKITSNKLTTITKEQFLLNINKRGTTVTNRTNQNNQVYPTAEKFAKNAIQSSLR